MPICIVDGDALVARSPAMREVCALAAKVAPTNAAVLLRGEPGVGKGLVARTIHRQSRRAGTPLFQVACGAVHEAQLDSTLFGQDTHDFEQGKMLCQGLLEHAHGKTVFLSNVDRLPLWAQVRLADALQRGYPCCESPEPLPLDMRMIASTSCDLETAVAEGVFSRKLYYLLSVVSIDVPPLRQRQQDLKRLVERCLAQTLAGEGISADTDPYRFTPKAQECLLDYDWPGNLPELANVIAHAVALAGGKEIGREAIVFAPRKVQCRRCDTISVPLAGNFHAIERSILEEVIRQCRGNKAAAARALGLHRRTLYRMLEDGDAGAGPDESRKGRQPR